MKNPTKTIIRITLGLLLILFTECSILEQDIDGNLSATLDIYEPTNGSLLLYYSTTVIDAESDEDISNNLDKIKSWRVTELSYSIVNFVGDPSITFSGSIGFSKWDASVPEITASVSNINFSSISDNGLKYKIDLSEAQLNTIAGHFDQDKAVKIYLDGELSSGPVELQVQIYAKVTVRAKVL